MEADAEEIAENPETKFPHKFPSPMKLISRDQELVLKRILHIKDQTSDDDEQSDGIEEIDSNVKKMTIKKMVFKGFAAFPMEEDAGDSDHDDEEDNFGGAKYAWNDGLRYVGEN